jgi:hypothetical protein
MESLQRVKLAGFDVVIAELGVKLDYLRCAVRHWRTDRYPATVDSQGSKTRWSLIRLRPRAVIEATFCLSFISVSRYRLPLAAAASMRMRLPRLQGVITSLASHGRREAEKAFTREFG